MLKRSCFLYNCPECIYETDNDKHFKFHVTTKHKYKQFKSFKTRYGNCEEFVGSEKTFKCFLCNSILVHRASVIDR